MQIAGGVHITIAATPFLAVTATDLRTEAGTPGAPAATPLRLIDDARVDGVDLKNNSVVLAECMTEVGVKQRFAKCTGEVMSSVADDKTKSRLALIHVGDRVRASVEISSTSKLESIEVHHQEVQPARRLLTMCAGYIVTLLLATFVTGGHPLRMIIGQDNRYSNSQFQMAVWFSVLVSTYLTLVVCCVYAFGSDFWGFANTPTDLLALSGASALTFGAAKGVTAAKVQAAIAAGAPNPKPPVIRTSQSISCAMTQEHLTWATFKCSLSRSSQSSYTMRAFFTTSVPFRLKDGGAA